MVLLLLAGGGFVVGVKAHASVTERAVISASVTERALTGASTSETTTTIATNEET